MFYQNETIKKVALCLAFISIFTITGCAKKQQEVHKVKLTSVETIGVKHGSMPILISYTGNLFSDKEVAVLPRIGGQVLEVNVDEGDTVSEGETLLRINTDTLEAQRQQLQASLDAAEAQYQKAYLAMNMRDTQTLSGVNQAEAGVSQSEYSVNQIKLSLDQAKIDLDRMESLYSKGAVARTTYENVKLHYDTLKQQYSALKQARKSAGEALNIARSNLTQVQVAQKDMQAAQAQIDALRASISLLDINIRDCEVKAPFSGVISYRNKSVSKGAMVGLGAPIFKIVDNSSLYLEGNVNESKLASLEVGAPVKLFFDAYPHKPFHGTVSKIIPAVKSDSMTSTVRVNVENEDGKLQQGMFARAEIEVKSVDGILVPPIAIVKNPVILEPANSTDTSLSKPMDPMESKDTYSVFVVKNGKAIRKNVHVAAINENAYLVTSGVTPADDLDDKDRIIITSVRNLQDKEPIQLAKKVVDKIGSAADANDKKSDDKKDSKSQTSQENEGSEK